MKQQLKALALISVLTVLGACSSTSGMSGSEAGGPGAGDPGAQSGAYGAGNGIGSSPYGSGGYGAGGPGAGGYGAGGAGGPGGAGGAGNGRVVYFDYDSSDVRADSRQIVEGNSRYLAGDPAATVVLEGHTDERGSREYNIALGERRANAVRQMLQAYGVQPQQMRTVSYGEERPAVAGSDEGSYSQNRRVEIVY